MGSVSPEGWTRQKNPRWIDDVDVRNSNRRSSAWIGLLVRWQFAVVISTAGVHPVVLIRRPEPTDHPRNGSRTGVGNGDVDYRPVSFSSIFSKITETRCSTFFMGVSGVGWLVKYWFWDVLNKFVWGSSSSSVIRTPWNRGGFKPSSKLFWLDNFQAPKYVMI